MVPQSSSSAKPHNFSHHNHPVHSPPSYQENDISPIIFSETVTTTEVVTTTTTQTITHFFSFPLWRKRTPTSSLSSRPTFGSSLTLEDSMPQTGSSSLRVDKELPPTPPQENHNSAETSLSPSRRTSLDEIADESRRPSLFPRSESPSRKVSTSSRPSSTVALAQAALGIGLPHVLSHASTSSASEKNTITFSSSLPSTPSGSSPSATANRRTSKWRALSTTGPSEQLEPGSRRSRGLSLGPASFLNLKGSESRDKGKEKEVVSPPKQLVRKASFWSRKKNSSSSEPSRDPPETLVLQQDLSVPSLPTITPISPFYVDISSPSADQQSSRGQHSRGLSRSHSDRASNSRYSPKLPAESDVPHRKRRPPRRPSTADILNRPPTTRFLSDARPVTASPLSTPTAELEMQFSDQQEQQHNSAFLRPRSQTNPPFLHRLSLNIFSSSPSQTLPASPSLTTPPIRQTPPKPSIDIPKPQIDEESPEGYLNRLRLAVSKSEIAGILASTVDPFHVSALKSYISQFDFSEDPLDVALRRLLMDVGLPRETQQIDRVMEAFASRYYQSHISLFTSEDHPYILAFSLIMLHTDAFNKSNKRKMTKADYIKNTRLPGVAPEVLDCFYDNIVFAPFIFVEDPLDVNGQRGLMIDGTPSKTVSPIGTTPSLPTNGSGSLILGKRSKVDPYYLISNNLLEPLRIEVEELVPLTDPYTYKGTMGPWDERELLKSFSQPSVIEVADFSRANPVLFSLSVAGGPPSPLVSALGSPAVERAQVPEPIVLKITKVGILNRKDDYLEGGKKAASRRWRPWSVILTGSQLLLFRDPSWADIVLSSSVSTQAFKPDELLSVKDSIAVFDRSYTKHECTFRFVLPDGRHILWGASTEEDMNEWISRINYASAFKSTGVRMRPLGMSGRDVQLTGVAAATSHLHDLQHASQSQHMVKNWDNDASHALMGMLSGDSAMVTPGKKPPRRITTTSTNADVDVPEAPEIDGADQFIATFDQVKADLAAGRCASPDGSPRPDEQSPSFFSEPPSLPVSPESVLNNQQLPSRSRVVLSKVKTLEDRITATQTQLDTDMRFVRNIAVLTPFQRATRERLVIAVQKIAKQVVQMRLDIARLSCHRDVLFQDLAAEAQDWSRAKKIALRAATETLQGQRPRTSLSIPRMTLSYHDSDVSGSPPIPIPETSYATSQNSLHRPESTADSFQSFHSALDFGPEWPSSDDIDAPDLLNQSHIMDSTLHGSISGGVFQAGTTAEDGMLKRTSEDGEDGSPLPRESEDSQPRSHEKFHTAHETNEEEEAEEWNKTRCAQRVSLVRLPSVLGFEKHRTNSTINE
ncbi:sec7 domain protein [Moniliophthora roreri MCA 2997]|uniref:Sec7 domain protein n=1 Tax=Moniliophthora roreri (strain MCA 2997) TaxID=1381753 RepID=V2Z316_MONRO|nr:sec7 domain protein [Moniliophthora roreri MCA 2997]